MNTSFGSWLKQRRRVLNRTQHEVAHQIGSSVILLRKVEADERRPSRQMTEQLADVLRIATYERAEFMASAQRLPPQHAPHYLPLPTSPFVGRSQELAQIGECLTDPTCRLLTLVGEGGIGKTQLGLQAAEAHRNPYRDGVFFVPLAGLSSSEHIIPSIAQRLQFNFVGNASAENQLLDYLHDKTLLLLLDNFEHLLDGRELLVKILESAAEVKLLITSRERLNLQHEWALEIQGLPFDVQSDDAVQLFIQRAVRINRRLGEADLSFVLEICRLLDGMPLGIELAASWLYFLTCQEIAEQMRASLDFLTSNAPDLEERHRSLQGVFDHSWSLLSPAAQAVFRKLSIFRGGFRQEAALIVAGATLASLAELRNKSLLRRDQSGRFHLHELLRQYASTHLEAEERYQTQFAHANYYAEFSHQNFRPLEKPLEEASKIFWEEIENVRLAWQWSADHQQSPFLHLMWEGLWFFTQMQDQSYDGRAIFDYAVARLQAPDLETRLVYATLRVSQAWFDFNLGQLEIALERANEGMAGFSALSISPGVELIHCHLTLAFVLHALGRYQEAKTHAEATGEIARSLEISGKFYYYISISLFNLAKIAYSMGEFERSRSALEAGQQLMPAGWWLGYLPHALGRIEVALGNYEAGEVYLQESLRIANRHDDQRCLVFALIDLGCLERLRQNYEEAWRCLHEAVRIAYKIRLISHLMEAIAEIGYLLSFTARMKQSVEWLTFTLNHPAVWQEARDNAARYLLEIQQVHPHLRLTPSQERGRGIDLETIVAWIDQHDNPGEIFASTQKHVIQQPVPGGELSKRELDVLRLIAEGLSNAEIAQRLYLSVGTVKVHTRHIYEKLGVKSRTQATVSAQKLGIL